MLYDLLIPGLSSYVILQLPMVYIRFFIILLECVSQMHAKQNVL